MKNQKKESAKPFGIRFLEQPSRDELLQVSGGRHHKHVFHSMDIIGHTPSGGSAILYT